jgi:hypothetical protein
VTRISTLRTSLLAGVLLIGLTACNTVPKASTAATVNGVSISKDSFEGFINEFSEIGQLNIPEGIAAGDDVRSILTAIIKENDYQIVQPLNQNVHYWTIHLKIKNKLFY